ncbi:MAG TPA: TolC family protein [Pelomicrobium sp.]|nr:TolC family protein [Pelomicrobium sp.]
MLDNRRAPIAPLKKLVAGACALTLAACAVTPEPLKREEVRERFAADQYLLYAEQEPITGPIDVNTAIARALKYNLDYRLKLMERALATGLWDVSRYDMLPKVVASAGYATRSNDSGGTSVSIIDGRETLSPSTSQERNRWLANAEFSWNLLDFGLSYYRARQLADETLISEERRRRVIQNIVQDTRSAYWRAVGAQRLAKKADDLLVRVGEALEKSRQAEAQGLLPPVQALAYQRALLDATTLLNIRRQELEFSKRELAALMNVTPGTDFTLADEREPDLPQPPRNIGELEEVALENRPELREEDYRKRISTAETRKALLSILPGISIDFAGRYDSNKYLYNQSWIDGGVQIFGNLMRLLAYPSVEKANELRLATDDARRVALSMAVITQVRVAVQRYELSLVDLDLAEQSTQVDARLAQYARVALSTRVDSELELVRTEARALIAGFQRYASYANAQAAYGRILNSLGVDVLPDEVQHADVNTLADAVAAQIKQAERDTFPVALSPVRQAVPPIRVQIENVDDPALKAAAEEAVIRALRRAGYTVDASDPKAWPLRMRFDLAKVRAGLDRGQWEIRLERADGSLVGRSEYSTALATQFRPSTMDAFTEAATVSQLRTLDGWLRDQPARSPKLTPTPPPARPAPAGPRGEAPTLPAPHALPREVPPGSNSLGLLLTLEPPHDADAARR